MNTRHINLNSLWLRWYHAVFIAVLFILIHGYRFNSGDQEEHLPQVYKMMDATLYPHDYFMQEVEKSFSIRFYYKWLVYLFAQLISLQATAFILTFVCLTITSWAVMNITRFFKEGIAELISPFLIMIFFVNITLGNNEFQNNYLVCSTISVMLCTLALLNFFRKNYLLMVLFCGLAGWFQILEAVLLIMVLLPAAFLVGERSFKQAIVLLLLFIVVSLPMLGPVVYNHFLNPIEYDQTAYYNALFNIRNPNHYLASGFPNEDYKNFLMLAIAGFISTFAIDSRVRKKFLIVTGIIISGMFVYYLLLEKAGVMVVGKTQWFKTSIWLTLFFSINIASLISLGLNRFAKNYSTGVYLFVSIIVMIGSVTIIFNSKEYKPSFLNQSWTVGNYAKSDVTLMNEWISTNTPNDAVFLISPSNQSFLCEAKRSLIIGYKAVIHEPFFIIPWAENYQRIYIFNAMFNKNENPVVSAYLSYNMNQYIPIKGEKLDYRIDDVTTCEYANALGDVVHRQGNLVLTIVK